MGTCPFDDILVDAGSDAGFPSCSEACIAQYPDGLAAFAPLNVCFSFECGTMAACGGTSNTCVPCLAESCAQVMLTLDLAPGGFGIFNCVVDCVGNAMCEDACRAQYPAAVKALEGYLACQESVCGQVCMGSGV
jgi:hypothetical protein